MQKKKFEKYKINFNKRLRALNFELFIIFVEIQLFDIFVDYLTISYLKFLHIFGNFEDNWKQTRKESIYKYR